MRALQELVADILDGRAERDGDGFDRIRVPVRPFLLDFDCGEVVLRAGRDGNLADLP